jgi:hypothetical protein
VLYGRDLIDAVQYAMLSGITQWLQRTARAWGGRDGSLNGLWSAILRAMVGTGFAPNPVGDGGWSSADGARRRLARVCRELDGSRDLVIALTEGRVPPLVIHAIEGRLSVEDEAELAGRRTGLDRIGTSYRKELRVG